MIYSPYDSIADRLARIKSQLAQYQPAPTLVAVSKQQPASSILEALEAGQSVFGENRVQEAKNKWLPLKLHYKQVELHLIGKLQTNKITEALALFDVIETLDSYKLAEALQDAMEKTGKRPDCYIQVNTGSEPQKAGILPEEAAPFIIYCQDKLRLPVTGLMCIPPVDDDPLPHFQALKQLASQHQLPWLSMGMSNDYDVALAAGATHIRVGRALFGERN